MAFWHLLLIASLLLSVDGLLEMAFLSSLVAYVQRNHGTATISIDHPPHQFIMYSNPDHWLLNGGHVSNAAGGTSFFLGLAGTIIAMCLFRPSTARKTTVFQRHGSILLTVFMTWSILAALLTLSALIAVNVVTNANVHSIDYNVAKNSGLRYWYPEFNWTPGNWYTQLLTLPITHQSDVNSIKHHLRIFAAGQWNLVPLFILGFVYSALAVHTWRRGRREEVRYSAAPFAVGKESPMSVGPMAYSP